MTTTISSSSIEADVREYIVARVELRMRTADAVNVGRLMADGLTFEAIRDALVAKIMGDPNWKAAVQ